MSKYHIVGNLMSRLICFKGISSLLKYNTLLNLIPCHAKYFDVHVLHCSPISILNPVDKKGIGCGKCCKHVFSEWKMWILIRWLCQKPVDLDLQ